MKIILLNTPLIKTKITRDMAGGLGFDATSETLLPPLDLAILAATIRHEGHQVKIIDPEAGGLGSREVVTQIIDWNPEVVVASISLPSIKNDTQFLKKLKKFFKGEIIGKTAITFKPILRQILKTSGVNFCLVGEVDLEILKILTGQSKKGTAYFAGKRLVVDLQSLVDNLDLLPLPARDLLKNSAYHYPLLGGNCTTMQTSRGCPFPCAYYCPYPLVQGRVWRAMSPARVYKELADIVQKHKIDKILFRDATFTLNKERTIKICQDIIKNKLKFSWWCETRINCLDRELLRIMKAAGCRGINIGVETGDPQLIEIEGKPGVSLRQLENIKKAADRIGIKLHFLLLIGLPGETRKSLYLTFKMIKRLRPYSLGATVVTPYPGTPLFENAKRKGWIETQDWKKYSGDLPTMHTDNLSSWEMKLAQKLIQAELIFLEKGLVGKIALIFEDLLFRIWVSL
ncbi:radical SAM protein [Candidatus Gottesmanbacteria bacterium]|nr:radical SAM protein [Candidatus Gottesmanbacteria bacterium]